MVDVWVLDRAAKRRLMSLLEYAFCFRVEGEHWKLSDEGSHGLSAKLAVMNARFGVSIPGRRGEYAMATSAKMNHVLIGAGAVRIL